MEGRVTPRGAYLPTEPFFLSGQDRWRVRVSKKNRKTGRIRSSWSFLYLINERPCHSSRSIPADKKMQKKYRRRAKIQRKLKTGRIVTSSYLVHHPIWYIILSGPLICAYRINVFNEWKAVSLLTEHTSRLKQAAATTAPTTTAC